jgi:hypothetical protein
VTEQIDWDCEVFRNYADRNMGCRNRVSSGLDWVFEQCEEAIILEDDSLPQPTFFPFCVELLEKYRHDKRVMMILGTCYMPLDNQEPYSYHFSHYFGTTAGWASWRRAWDHYDVDMKTWPKVKKTPLLLELWGDQVMEKYWHHIIEKTYRGKINTWDFQWFYTIWLQKGLIAIPNINQMTNIGYGEGATHTTNVPRGLYWAGAELPFPLEHPPKVEINPSAASVVFKDWQRKAVKFSKKNQLRSQLYRFYHKLIHSSKAILSPR